MTNLELIILARHAEWRYRLDRYEAKHLKVLLGIVEQVRQELFNRLKNSLGETKKFSTLRSKRVLSEIITLTTGIQSRLGLNIAEIATLAGVKSFEMQNDILSFGGRVPGFNYSMLSYEQIRSLIVNTPVGGKILNDWITSTFDTRLQGEIKDEIGKGLFQGESYKKFTDRVDQKFDIIKSDVITLVRTYVQDINVRAMTEVYENNQDLVEKIEWSAVMEPGYFATGRGTCVRCQALDGNQYDIDGRKPRMPLHGRCRCLWLPVLTDWRNLGIDIDEFEDAYRPYTIRPDKNIDTGLNRAILAQGFEGGHYVDFFWKQTENFQRNAVGPRRLELLKSGKVNFTQLVDKLTGRLHTIKELTNL